MTAISEAGGTMNSSPQMKLKIAFPLVSGESPNATPGSIRGTAAPVCASRPQTEQKCSPSAMLLPHPRQNEIIHFSSKLRGTTPQKIARNILFVVACVNAVAHTFDLSERFRFDMLPRWMWLQFR
jgi:hypothetical protein